MKNIFTLVIVTFLSFGAFSASKAESIQAKLKNVESIRTSDFHQFSKKLKSFTPYISEMNDYERDYYQYLNSYANVLTSQIDVALKTLESLSVNSKYNDIKAKSSFLLINTFALNRNWEKGLLQIEKAKEIFNNIKDNKLLVDGHISIGVFYNQLGEYSLGLNHANQVHSLEANDISLCKAKTIANEAKYELSEDISNIKSTIELCNNNNERIWSNLNRTYLASALLKEKKYQDVINLLSQKLSEVESTGYQLLMSEFYRLLAQSFLKLDDITNAHTFAKRIIDLNFKKTPYKPVVTAYYVLHQVEKARNNLDKSIAYLERYHKFDKININESKAKTLAVQTVKHKVEAKNSQIELLNKKNETLNLEKTLSAKDSENKKLMILLLTFIIVFITLWAYRTKKTHIKLRQLAEFDSLTGIHNRRHFTKQCEASLKQSKSNGNAVSFILFDLDKFKSINDTYGHPIGDWALKNVSSPVLDVIRKIDLFGRMGGEEFAVLLPGCELEQAREIAEDIRKGLMQLNTKESGFEFTVTASFGVTVSRISGYDFDALMKHSDLALYESKHSGRNKTTVYSMPPTESYDEIKSLK
jgi:diguanylate cyclase (GGDEF)-like protein